MSAADVRAWLEQVARDLDAAWSCSRGERAVNDRAAYHVQQAAEKLVKAVLVAHEIPPPRFHDIEVLAALLPAGVDQRDRYLALDRFTMYATTFRYPSEEEDVEPEPTTEEIDAWIEEVRSLKLAFEATLPPAPASPGKDRRR
jgi:HEPN domain-containing protein